jgi:iron complex outermembrane recepter protein
MRLIVVACLLLFNFATGQHKLSCFVWDIESSKPLSSVSVFLPELHLGTYTNEKGVAEISAIPGNSLLVEFSHVGYQTVFKTIKLPFDSALRVGLEPSHISISEVVVTGNRVQAPDESTFNIVQLPLSALNKSGFYNLSDAISSLPGVSQLTTGPGISKPVIRGLYGNRIQVTLNGLRFDNQQWQDEHGLGLSDVGVDRVEVIRGPASVLYGSDAIGGVVNIVDEKPAAVNTTINNLTAKLYANTYGLALSYGRSRSSEHQWNRFRIGIDNHADYSDGEDERVLNSRFASYNLKSSWGSTRSDRVRVTTLMVSHSMFGFVFDSLNRKTEDARLSRSFDGPHHAVSFAQLSSENTIFKSDAEIKINAGFISNLRLEDEGGGGISLSMLLNTLNAAGQVTRRFATNGEVTSGLATFFQANTNFGGRVIIPDAINGELSFFSLYKRHVSNFMFEGGLRYDLKYIETFATRNLNVIGNDSPTEEILPFGKLYHAFNFSLGATYAIADNFHLKGIASTGFRPGNLAELSSNGLHEGTLRWEIGIPQAKLERNLNLEGSLNYHSPSLRTSISIYRNAFRNFFFLAPDGSEFFGFQVYHFRQRDAQLKGGDLSFEWNPDIRIGFEGSYSFIEATMSNGGHLPFIPANKVNGEMRVNLNAFGPLLNPSFSVGGNYAFDQTHPAEFETKTADYFLLNCAFDFCWNNVNAGLSARNILNENYYDHLSRYKYYGIANMGRSIMLIIKLKF